MTLRHHPLRLRAALAGMALVLAVLAAWAIVAAQPSSAAAPTGTALISPAASGPKVLPTITTEPLPSGAVVTQVLPNMNLPTAMVFDPAGRLFYTEKTTGNVRLFENGVLQTNPVITFGVSGSGERGLLGITLHPDFSNNHLVYVYYTSNQQGSCPSGNVENRVTHFVETNGVGSNPETIFFSCQSAGNHVGGNIHFAQDGKLYITIGENATPANSQNPGDKRGKIHRVNPDGTLPTDPPNPVITATGQISSVFAMGLRNSFDFDFDPLTPPNPWPRLFASENGPSCDDEMNRIEGGYNYGWRPSYPCDDPNPNPAYNTIPPMWHLGSGQCCQAPTGAHVYRGLEVPQWTNDLFMCTYNNGALRHFYLDPTRTFAITVATVTGVSCGMDIETGPDGAFYYIQGGGYTPGTLYKITVPGAITATPTATQPTATRTATSPPATPTNTAPPATATNTAPPATATNTVPPTTPTATVTGTHVMPSPTATQPGGATGTPTTPPTATATNTAVNFQDVPPSNTFYPFVSCLARIGIVQGYPCGGVGEPCGTTGDPYFRPNAYVTRGQIAKIVAESAFFDQQIPPDQQTFEDVPPGSTFWLYIERLAGLQTNIVSGYPCGSTGEPCVPPNNRPYFRPNTGATRGQLTKIVSSAAGFNDAIPTTQYTFTDVEPGHTFWLYVERLLENRPGVMGGYVCGGPGEPCDSQNRPYFRPNNPLTRGQTSKIVANTFFPDCIVPVVVKIENYAYWPADITVGLGTTVRFINRDVDSHTATEDGNVWDTGMLAQHQFADVVMNTVADYGYFCIPHPFMRGAVHVR
jgi:glucose/arabinose dehydrogenase